MNARRWLTLVALLAGVLPASAQVPREEGLPNIDEQTHVFRRMLYEKDCEPLTRFEDLKPENSVLILLGDMDGLRKVPGGWQDWLQRGGSLLIATDRLLPPDLEQEVLRTTGAGVTGDRYSSTSLFGPRYRDKPDCPVLKPVARAQPNLLPPETLLGNPVATNIPSGVGVSSLRGLAPGIRPLAELDSINRIERGSGSSVGAMRDVLFAVGGPVGQGRVLLLADHSVFINEMMAQTDNANIEFAAACVDYLQREDKSHTKVLFVEEGSINPNFDIPLQNLPPLPMPTLDEIVGVLNGYLASFNPRLAAAQEDDKFNRGLGNFLLGRNTGPGKLFAVCAVILSVSLLLYACGRYGIARTQRWDRTWSLLPQAVEKHRPKGTVLEQRQEHLATQGNLWEAARLEARGCFAAVPQPVDWRKPPKIHVAGNRWRRFWTRRRVCRVWRLAFHPRAHIITVHQWPHVRKEIDRLRRELAAGAVHLG